MKFFYPQCRANIGIVPRGGNELLSLLAVPVTRAELTMNDVFTADEFDIEIDGHILPTDPRGLRCFMADIHLADVGDPSKNLTTGSDDTRLLVGHADSVSREYRDQALKFSAKGRDFTGLLLDAQWGDRSVELDRSLGDIVAEIVWSNPSTEDLEIVEDEPFIVPGDSGSKKRGVYRAARDMSLWEAITQIALRAGAVVTIELDRVRIRAPRTIESAVGMPVFVEGQNISSLKVARELATTSVPNIRVRAFDQASGETVIGKWPEKPTGTARATKSKKSVDVEFEDHVIRHPAPTAKLLNAIARRIYTQRAFSQITVELETRDMLAFDSDGEPVPLTTVRNGSAFRLHIDRDSRDILELAISDYEKARLLERQGFERQVAESLTRGARIIDAVLFVDRARHSFSADDGYTLAVDGVTVFDGGE